MKSVLLSQDDVSHADQFDNQAREGTDRSTAEQATIAQLLRQEFDMSIDETLEGLQGVQQVLYQLEAKFFSVPISTLTPEARLKVRRMSHHCTRLIAEVEQLLQPFSQEQIFISLEAQPVSAKENMNIEGG